MSALPVAHASAITASVLSAVVVLVRVRQPPASARQRLPKLHLEPHLEHGQIVNARVMNSIKESQLSWLQIMHYACHLNCVASDRS